MTEEYINGFCKMAESYGIDPEQLVPEIRSPDMHVHQEKEADAKSLVAKAMLGLSLGGLGITGHGLYRMSAPAARAMKTVRNLPRQSYSNLMQQGYLPGNAVLATNKEQIVNHLLSADKNSGALKKKLQKTVAESMADMVLKGDNAAYAGIRNGKPVFMGPPNGMNSSIAAHESGHYYADMSRGRPGVYEAELAAAQSRFPRPGDLFYSPSKSGYRRGVLPELEREAWDMAPRSYDPALREKALASYIAQHKGRAETAIGGATSLSGLLLSPFLALLKRRKYKKFLEELERQSM